MTSAEQQTTRTWKLAAALLGLIVVIAVAAQLVRSDIDDRATAEQAATRGTDAELAEPTATPPVGSW